LAAPFLERFFLITQEPTLVKSQVAMLTAEARRALRKPFCNQQVLSAPIASVVKDPVGAASAAIDRA
jgi:hypothetical protein